MLYVWVGVAMCVVTCSLLVLTLCFLQVLFYNHPVQRLCENVVSLLSLFPGNVLLSVFFVFFRDSEKPVHDIFHAINEKGLDLAGMEVRRQMGKFCSFGCIRMPVSQKEVPTVSQSLLEDVMIRICCMCE